MKKNVIAILLAVCMLLALTACAAKAPAADTAQKLLLLLEYGERDHQSGLMQNRTET